MRLLFPVGQCKATLLSLENKRNAANSNRQTHCCTYKKNFQEAHKIPYEFPVVECDFKKESKESCAQRVAANVQDIKMYITTTKQKHDDEKKTCEEFKVSEKSLKGSVTAKIADIAAQEERLRNMDADMDKYNSNINSLVELTNQNYDTCRSGAEAIYNTLWSACVDNETAECGLPKRIQDRKKEWQAVGELKCIFTSYSASSGGSEFDEANQQACVDQINTDNLSIEKVPIPERKAPISDSPIDVVPPSTHTTTAENPEKGCFLDSGEQFDLVVKPQCPQWCPQPFAASY